MSLQRPSSQNSHKPGFDDSHNYTISHDGGNDNDNEYDDYDDEDFDDDDDDDDLLFEIPSVLATDRKDKKFLNCKC